MQLSNHKGQRTAVMPLKVNASCETVQPHLNFKFETWPILTDKKHLICITGQKLFWSFHQSFFSQKLRTIRKIFKYVYYGKGELSIKGFFLGSEKVLWFRQTAKIPSSESFWP